MQYWYIIQRSEKSPTAVNESERKKNYLSDNSDEFACLSLFIFLCIFYYYFMRRYCIDCIYVWREKFGQITVNPIRFVRFSVNFLTSVFDKQVNAKSINFPFVWWRIDVHERWIPTSRYKINNLGRKTLQC